MFKKLLSQFPEIIQYFFLIIYLSGNHPAAEVPGI